MKTNGAPEKIYLQVCGDYTLNDKETCEQCCKDNPIGNGSEVTWCVDKIFNNDEEYTRTDAFIEKACSWLKSKGGFTIGFPGTEVKDFKNYMEGE